MGSRKGRNVILRSHQSKVFRTEPLGPENIALGQLLLRLRHREIMSAGTEHANLNRAKGHASATRYDEP
jgi:hypothetical protein